MRRCFFLTYRPRTEFIFLPYLNFNSAVFHNFARQIAFIQSVQDDRRTHLLSTTNYGKDHVIKRFHEENSIMQRLFSQKNMLLCHM